MEELNVGDKEGEDSTSSSAAGYTRNADGDHTGTASNGDFDGDGSSLSEGGDNKDKGEEMRLRTLLLQLEMKSMNLCTECQQLQEQLQVLVAAVLAAGAVMEEEMQQRGGIQAILLPLSLGVVIEIASQERVPNELVAMLTTMMTSPSSSS